MAKYIDGFVIPLPISKIDDYKRIAERAGALWKEHGALEYWECLGDDLDVKDMVSFRRAAGCSADETVVFSWIVFASREDRDRINAAVMADPRLKEGMEGLAENLDCKRMVYGGFRKMVEL